MPKSVAERNLNWAEERPNIKFWAELNEKYPKAELWNPGKEKGRPEPKPPSAN